MEGDRWCLETHRPCPWLINGFGGAEDLRLSGALGGENESRGTLAVFIRVRPTEVSATQTRAGIAILQIKMEKQRLSKCPEIPQVPSELRGKARKRTFPMIDGSVYF